MSRSTGDAGGPSDPFRFGREVARYHAGNLLDQLDIKDPSGKKKISEIINEKGAKIGEKVALRRFVRFEVGEGIEKETVDYAKEVAQTVASFQQ